MKSPKVLISLLFLFSYGCSDESTFTGTAGKLPSTLAQPTSEEAANPPPPEGDALPDPSSVREEEKSIAEAVENENPNQEKGKGVESSSQDDFIPTLPDSQVVTKVGINFEDRPGSDADFNDAVLCFTGGFEVSSSIIQATKDQTVRATLFSEALCSNQIRVSIIRSGQTISTVTYNPKSQHSANLEFKKGDRLLVNMVSVDCDPGALYPMTDTRYTELAPDVCHDR